VSVEGIKSQLEQVAEQMDDLITAILHEAVQAGASQRPEAEKKLSRARRSVEKAISLLDNL